MRWIPSRSIVVSLLVVAVAAASVAAQSTTTTPARTPDVPYVPTPQKVVDEMLRVAEVKRGDIVYDLGSGDGRIVITAAQRYGVRGIGIDIDPARVQEARENARRAGVEDKVKFVEGDIFQTDFSEATVITMYLLPSVNMKLKPKLQALRPGTRIVSHSFDLGDWTPKETLKIPVDGTERTVYYWVVPTRGARQQ